MIITSKYSGKCRECQAAISPGDRVDWTKGVKGVRCGACSPDLKREQAAVEESRATDADVEVPAPEGLSYLPYQRGGIAFAMARRGVLIGDEMGLGKTIQAIGIANADESVKTILVVCPASLKLNWAREMQKWLVRPSRIVVFNGKDRVEHDSPDAEVSVTVVNYDVLKKRRDELLQDWDMVIIDEAHYCKNGRSQRSKATREIVARARRRVLLTGTPIANRPVELWPLLQMADPDHWDPAMPAKGKWPAREAGSGACFMRFAKRYCDAQQIPAGRKMVWDFSGSSNLQELQVKLRTTCMVRRLKKDVLTELPPKQRQIIEIPSNGASRAVKAERDAWDRQAEELEGLRTEVELSRASDDPEDHAEAVRRLGEATKAAFAEIAKLRHDTAVAKLPHVVEHIRSTLEDDPDAKIIVMAHHHDVIDGLVSGLAEFGAVELTGRTDMQTRQANVDRFQSDPACRVFVGSITAAGVGITLTASSHVIFAELDWVPGNVSQAEDRAHRIGQQSSVLVQHLVLEESLDLRMAQTLVEKQRVADLGLDKIVKSEPALPMVDRAATADARRDELAAVAKTLGADTVEDIHGALRRLAGLCDGASTEDGRGFAKIDVRIGHSLAASARLTRRQAALGLKLVRKYRRQLGDAAVAILAATTEAKDAA